MPQYHKQWGSWNPGMLVILLDQSSSMNEEYCFGKSKAKVSSHIVNWMIDRIIKCNYNGFTPRNRCYINVIGYDDAARTICSGWLSELYESPLRIETEIRKVSDGAGGFVDVPVKMPIWVDSVAEGQTDMLAAFKSAIDLIKSWNDDHADGPAPIIVNIFDYIPSDIEETSPETHESILSVVEDIKQLSNEDGEPLIYNICLDGSTFLKWPIVSSVNSVEQTLCKISSIIPRSQIIDAKKNGITIDANASCCIVGGSVDDISRFLIGALSNKIM